jgi:type II secretory pathway component GspD/PulD (secretin)
MNRKKQSLIYPQLASLLFLTMFANASENRQELYLEEKAKKQEERLFTIQFNDVPVIEFIRFVGKISKENFIFNNEDLGFNITFSSGQPVTSDSVVKALIRLLDIHQFKVVREEGYYVIHKMKSEEDSEDKEEARPKLESSTLIASTEEIVIKPGAKQSFFVYKLQYHEGAEIVEALKKIATDLSSQGNISAQLLQSIHTLQWVKATNSLLCSGDESTIEEIKKIISSLDAPLRQVFIEVLVIETDVKKGMDFGLQWAAGGQFKSKFGFGVGNFAPQTPNTPNPSFTNIMQGINATNTPTGLNQVPVVPGFDLGVIGDVITHKGKSYFTLGSLVTALQLDTDSTIVLNQKIITQDNKHSKIFVGDNIPFTGSVVQTVGQSQQTTANIEYRDVGVSLNITPMLGEGDVITLNLDEEITEAVDDPPTSNANVNGIRTTKTNMLTHVHVPKQDKRRGFLFCRTFL